MCDKHNTSDISINISTRKKGTCSFFLVLMLMSLVLCLSHKCEPGFNVKTYNLQVYSLAVAGPNGVELYQMEMADNFKMVTISSLH